MCLNKWRHRKKLKRLIPIWYIELSKTEHLLTDLIKNNSEIKILSLHS